MKKVPCRFVDRYIPGYVFFGDGPTIGFGGDAQARPAWIGRSLCLHIDESRSVVDVERF